MLGQGCLTRTINAKDDVPKRQMGMKVDGKMEANEGDEPLVGSSHHGTARRQVADGGDFLQIRTVAANIPNTQ